MVFLIRLVMEVGSAHRQSDALLEHGSVLKCCTASVCSAPRFTVTSLSLTDTSMRSESIRYVAAGEVSALVTLSVLAAAGARQPVFLATNPAAALYSMAAHEGSAANSRPRPSP
jgi:hypothetical protein